MVKRQGPAGPPGTDAEEVATGDDGVQARVERSIEGQGVISAFVLFTVFAVLVSNLPVGSRTRETLLPPVDSYLVGTGLKQGWGVFAPDPTRRTSQLSAEVRFADGSITMWHLPKGGNGLGEYRWFRWRQFGQDIMGTRSQHLRKPFARWIALEHATDGRKPTVVTLIRRRARTPAPGSDEPPRWERQAFYRLFIRSTSGSAP